jgi:hypothetical protein
MSWRDSLTTEQRDLVARQEAAYAARRAATRNTPDCLNCEGWWNASGADGITSEIVTWCDCTNGQALKASYATARQQYLADLEFQAQKKAAEAARRAKACTRCGGSGMYGHHGSCFRCNGIGVDPKYLKK